MIPLKEFISAGHAIFTVELPEALAVKNGLRPHYTFRVMKPEDQDGRRDFLFAAMLTGPENMSDYQYLGVVHPDGHFRTTRASSGMHGSFPARLLERVCAAAWSGREAEIEAAGFKVHHENKCCCCGRRLTTPESVESGIGPICAGRE